MTSGEDRRERLRGVIDRAQEALDGLSEDSIDEVMADGRDHLSRVLSYAQLVVATTDPLLISDTAINELEAAASTISADPQAAARSPDAYATRVIDATVRFPVAQGRGIEQSLRDAAASFESSVRERLDALRERYAESDNKLDEIHAQADAIQRKISEFETSLSASRTELDTMLQRHSGDFTAAQEARTAEFQGELQSMRNALGELQEEARKEVESRVAEIRRMEEHSAALVGAIGLAGTAERYGEEFKEQRTVADRMRLLTIALALGAFAMAAYAVVAGDQTPEALVAKLAVSAVLGGLATYTARQSGRHRKREEEARALQLELTAFAPFIEPLDPAQKEEERVIMTRKTFGRAAGANAEQEDYGPSPLSFLMRRRQKELDDTTA